MKDPKRPILIPNDCTGLPEPRDVPPGLLDSDLRRLDARLTDDLHRSPVPPGLADRVFDESVGHLPPRRLVFAPPTKRTIRQRRQWMGRIAMAAGIALAFTLSVRMMKTTEPTPTTTLASIQSLADSQINSPDELRNDIPLSIEGELALLALLDTDDLGGPSHLALTRDITYSDMADDFVAILTDFESEYKGEGL